MGAVEGIAGSLRKWAKLELSASSLSNTSFAAKRTGSPDSLGKRGQTLFIGSERSRGGILALYSGSNGFFVGLDLSLDGTHICVVDEGGLIIKETRAASEPVAIAKAIRHKGRRIEHVGLETENLSQWLYDGLALVGLA